MLTVHIGVSVSIINHFDGDAARAETEGGAGAERVVTAGENVVAGAIGEDDGGLKDEKAEITRQKVSVC